MRNKNNVRKRRFTYSDWLVKVGGEGDRDPLGEERIGKTPFTTIPLPPLLEDVYDTVEDLYYGGYFKPRHKQIVGLLLKGYTDHGDMAERLGIKRSTVTGLLRQIGKKVLKNVNKFAV